MGKRTMLKTELFCIIVVALYFKPMMAELWKTNSTLEGTTMMKDIDPGSESGIRWE